MYSMYQIIPGPFYVINVAFLLIRNVQLLPL